MASRTELPLFVKEDGVFHRFYIQFGDITIAGDDLITFPKEKEEIMRRMLPKDSIYKANMAEFRETLKKYRDDNISSHVMEVLLLMIKLNVPFPTKFKDSRVEMAKLLNIKNAI